MDRLKAGQTFKSKFASGNVTIEKVLPINHWPAIPMVLIKHDGNLFPVRESFLHTCFEEVKE